MGKEQVNPKSGEAEEKESPEKGLIQKLTDSVDALLGRLEKVEAKAEASEEQRKTATNLWESLFGPMPTEESK